MGKKIYLSHHFGDRLVSRQLDTLIGLPQFGLRDSLVTVPDDVSLPQ